MNATAVQSAVSHSPAKIVLERRVRADGRRAFEAWVDDVLALAAQSAALQGATVLQREAEYFILLRFSSAEALEHWRTSAAASELLRRGDDMSESLDQPVVRTGLETWFTVPTRYDAAVVPPKWKMALVTWLALVPQVLVLALVTPTGVPLLASIAFSTAIPVALLTWIIMPRLTRLLSGWLYTG